MDVLSYEIRSMTNHWLLIHRLKYTLHKVLIITNDLNKSVKVTKCSKSDDICLWYRLPHDQANALFMLNLHNFVKPTFVYMNQISD
jgi:hypothetical protein